MFCEVFHKDISERGVSLIKEHFNELSKKTPDYLIVIETTINYFNKFLKVNNADIPRVYEVLLELDYTVIECNEDYILATKE